MQKTANLLYIIRALLLFFMGGLILSGLSAVPLQWEVGILMPLFGSGSWFSQFFPALSVWIDRVSQGVLNGYGRYPFLAYGTDWLAFGHVAIAVAFIGPLRDPLKNLWVVEFGMIICLLTIPWTLIFGPLRGIPFFWMLMDMSFGAVGVIPLWIVRKSILKLTSEP
jgi:hypothetical protein